MTNYLQHHYLYKRAKSGKVLIWYMEQDGANYRTISGIKDGKLVITDWTVAKPKNVGKKNETTDVEQATLQIESIYMKQLKSDYFYNINDIDNETYFHPMLAKNWKDEKKKITYEFMDAQPKLDGMRCIATKSGCFSRNGERWMTTRSIEEALKPIFDETPDLIIDGELYNHAFKHDFNKISSLIKKTKPTEEDLVESAKYLEFWVYDIYSDYIAWEGRKRILEEFFAKTTPPIVLTPTVRIRVEEADAIGYDFLDQGFEGAIFRLDDYGYEKDKRSKGLLKWKVFEEEEFPIKDIVEGEGNRSGMAASVLLTNPEGKEFSAGVIGNETYLKWLLENKAKFIGLPGTVVFQNYTPDGIPRFGKFKIVRDYE